MTNIRFQDNIILIVFMLGVSSIRQVIVKLNEAKVMKRAQIIIEAQIKNFFTQ